MKSRKLHRLSLILLVFLGTIIPVDLFPQWEIQSVGVGAQASIAVDPEGGIHLCFITEPYSGNLVFASLDSDIWLMDTLVHSGIVFQCAIAAGPDGSVHIAFVEADRDAMIYSMQYIFKDVDGWSAPDTIFTSSTATWGLSFTADTEGFLHLAYVESNRMTSRGPLGYINNLGGYWKTDYPPLPEDDYVYNSASMAVDLHGYAHFAFYKMPDGPTYITNAPDGSWSDIYSLHNHWAGGQMEGMHIDIAVDTGGIPHVSYVGSDFGEGLEDHRYATKIESSWINQLVDKGYFLSTGHAISCDPGGAIQVAYIHWETGDLRYATNDSGSWSYKIIDTPGAAYYRTVDMVTSPDGFAHIVYEKNEQIFYATNRFEIPAPNIILSPSALAFGTVDTFAVSTRKLTIRNEGNLDLHVSGILLSGDHASEFSLEHFCNTILAGDSCMVSITFAPLSIGNKKSTLEITSDDPDSPLLNVSITGRTPYPVIQADPGSLKFSIIETGEADTLILTLVNAGDADLEIDSMKLTGSGTGAFSYGSFCTTVPPASACPMKVTFTPFGAGSQSDTLDILSNDPEQPVIRIPLEGRTPSARLEVEYNVLDFGPTPVGKITSKQLVLKNTGEKILNISSFSVTGSDLSLFKSTNTCNAILPGDSCRIQMVFYPLSPGVKSAGFDIISNVPDQPVFSISLCGTGTEFQSMSSIYGREGKETMTGSEKIDRFYCMDALSSGGFIVGGIAANNAYLSRLAPDGSILWQKNFSPASGGKSDIQAVQETWDKGYIIAGSTDGNYRWIARLAAAGWIKWQKQAEDDYWGKIRDLDITSDSGIIAVGETWPRGPGDPDLWIGKFDSTGTLLWEKRLGSLGAENWERGFDVLETVEGSFIVAGSSTTDNFPCHALCRHLDGGYLYGGNGAEIMKFSADGVLLWQKEIAGNPKFWLVRFNNEDSILWQYSYPQLNAQDQIFDLATTGSGDIIAVGVISIPEHNTNTMQVMKLTGTGDISWQKKFSTPGNQFGYKIRVTSAGSVAIAGSYDLGDFKIDGWLCLLSPEGLLDGCGSDYIVNSNTEATPTSYSFENINLPTVVPTDLFKNGVMTGLNGTAIRTTLCTGITTDPDYDGVLNDEEYGPSGQDKTFDGNNDGLPDALQNNVASLHSFNGLEYLTIEVPAGIQLNEVHAAGNPAPDEQPEQFEFPAGFFDFFITGIDTGGSVSVTLLIPGELSPDTYFKYAKTKDNPDPHWYEFLYDNATGAMILPHQLILHFTDGERGDEDLARNAVIEDIGGPAITSSTRINDLHSTITQLFINPNPFKTSATIHFSLPEPGNVKIEVYNFMGQKIRTLRQEKMEPGSYETELQSGSLPCGIYFLQMEAGNYRETRRIIVLK